MRSTCGGGEKERTFNVTKHPINNGITCEAGDGEKETQTCNTQSCRRRLHGSWSDWSVCSANCDGGTQSRSFTITKPASTGGVQCPASNGETQTRDCNQQSCPVECEGSWRNLDPVLVKMVVVKVKSLKLILLQDTQ